MNNNFHEQISAAIKATVFYSPTNFSWFGKLSSYLPRKLLSSLSPQTARNYLRYNLQTQLYVNFYCRGFASAAEQESFGISPIGLTSFVQELSNSNSGNGYWEDGWEVFAVESNRVVVKKGDLKLWARLIDCLLPNDSPIEPGMMLSLHFPKEFKSISPGFYMAMSDTELTDIPKNLIRFYWNFTSEGAVSFMKKASLMLNQANLSFKLKALNDITQYTRCDAVVLYTYKRDYNIVSNILKRIYPEVKENLKPGIPAFTKAIAEGVGLAEDPGNGESFGLHRCQLLAEGMIRAYEQGKKSIDDRLQIVEEHFKELCISLNEPYLNPGSNDIYNFQFRSEMHQPHSYLIDMISKTDSFISDSKKESFLNTAIEIGDYLSKEAIWYKGCCNWLGFSPDDSSPADLSNMKYSAMGPELYSGTSGIALFLIELYSVTGDSTLRKTALGAIRQSLLRADTLHPSSNLGLYTGCSGIALSTARIGTILHNEELIRQARLIIQHSCKRKQAENNFDLLYGSAGVIVALLSLKSILNDIFFLDFAVQLGDELMKTAQNSEFGCSWKSFNIQKHRNLTGFSHGTAGAAYALLELSDATGDLKYYHAAENAFSYERHWFDPIAGNWPDFRQDQSFDKGSKHPRSFSTTWCHGAPGIALSRLRAFEIYNDIKYKDEAIYALKTTFQSTKLWLYSGSWNYSLCHGLAGNSDVLLYGYEILGKEWDNGFALPYAVGSTGIEKYSKNGHQWPCGTGGKTPSLMLGLAGIGYFYLRLYNSSIQSPLMFRKEKYVKFKP